MKTAHAPLSGRRVLSLRACGLALAAVAFAGLSGCGGPKEAANSVSGKVTLGNEPVTGTIFFVAEDGKQAETPITPTGTYVLSNPPLGKCKVLVKGMGGPVGIGPGPKDMNKDLPAMPGAKAAAPPAKYATAAGSDIVYEVKPGKQTFDVPLKN